MHCVSPEFAAAPLSLLEQTTWKGDAITREASQGDGMKQYLPFAIKMTSYRVGDHQFVHVSNKDFIVLHRKGHSHLTKIPTCPKGG